MTERTLLMIPGPIELEPAVLRALGAKTRGHLDPVFMASFGRALQRLREVFQAPTAQPIVVAGSGTLAMELAVANLIERGDRALVVNVGYFSDRLATMLERHGAMVEQVRVEPAQVPSVEAVEAALTKAAFKVVTITHVDTSTAVRSPVEAIATVARAHGALVIVDGVCSVGGETLEMERWGVDVTFTASQKALGAPPGLAIALFSQRALQTVRARKTPVASMYCDLNEWLPIHEAYEANKPAYFATPPTNLVTALEVSLGLLVEEGMAARVARHQAMAEAFRAGFAALGLEQVPAPEVRANTLSLLRYPTQVDATLIKAVAAEGVLIAGGLHPALKTSTFRIGHMGAVSLNDVSMTLGALERGLKSLRR